MKKLKLFITTLSLIVISFAGCDNPKNLYDLIGLNINSNSAKAYIKNLGECKTSDLFDTHKDYHYENAGIKFRTTLSGEIVTILCFNENKQRTNQLARFSGKLPFNLTFDDNLEEIQNKIGEGEVMDYNGFYGRVYRWIIQDSLRVGMEMRLPSSENEKLFIDYISLSKKN